MAESASDPFAREDLERIVARTFVERIDFHREIGSTNDRALQLASRQDLPLPVLVLAQAQTAGRGRGDNRWWSDGGALTFSVLLNTQAAALPADRWPQASLTAGLAVCEALEEIAGSPMGIKWPNDVYAAGRKVSGILVEAPRGREAALVVGIGVNVNNSLQAAPEQLRATATSLRDLKGVTYRLVDVLIGVLQRLEERISWIGTRDGDLRQRWRQRCVLTDRTVHLESGQRRLVGICRGIDDEGALLLDTRAGQERCFAGVVQQFE